MSERGNTTHGFNLDDELQQEEQAIIQGHRPGHVEDFRQTEPLPDDTDSDEVNEASGLDPVHAPDFSDRGAAQIVEEAGTGERGSGETFTTETGQEAADE
ncbi:hypothetical protein [Planctomonas deserti]|jgi:hypothetical protein|uniref:hypothetical protein n=1 Tax=Planctomonas deserti TaxID=2144185 RepID=UPI00197BB5EF|nr:hypothetical protein [Planctomonas deserti]